MKRTSAHITRAPSASVVDAPRRASGPLSTAVPPPAPIEQLRFRERDGKPSAYTRLYAQGVDQLVHKDQVYQQFGLHKSPPAPSLQARNKPTSAVAAPETTSHVSRASNVRNPTPTTLRYRSSSTVTSRVTSTRSTGTGRGPVTPRYRSNSGGGYNSAQYPKARSSSDGKRPMNGTSGSNRSSAVISNKAAPTPAARPTTAKPHRRQSVIATQLLSKTLKIGPALIHSVSSTAMLPASQARSPRMSMTAGSLQRRPSVGPMGSPTFLHQHPQQSTHTAQLNRRQSLQVTATSRPAAGLPASKSVGKPPSKDSPVRLNDSPQPPQPAVLIPVSRRTSSPLVAPNLTDFGMRRRPSVSPIRTANGHQPTSGATTSTSDGAGGETHRPSMVLLQRRDSKMDRLVEQITVLKNSLGLSDEDLQWKVESTKGNAYEAADRHLGEAEELYDRLVYEIQLLSETPCDEASVALVKRLRELIKQNNLVAELKPALANCQAEATQRKKELLDARIACELQVAKCGGAESSTAGSETEGMLTTAQQRLDDTKQRILQTQNQIKDEMTKLNELLVTLGKETDTLAAASARFKFLSPEAADVSAAFLNILRCIPECAGEKLVTLCEQGVQMAQQFTGSKAKELKRKEAESEKALRDIEVWKARKEQSKEFAQETAKRERQWKRKQHESNLVSLRLLRSLVPADIQQITADTLIERAAAGGVLYTYDLALYIKQNRLLHWLVTHESDVVRDNFLAIECASYFLNFTAYDINELRAVCEILPDAFDFDKEGKKAEWKRQFMEHVRMLVKQQSGETIKAGWDPTRGARAEVPLKPLSDKQQLNLVYRYPTEEEIKARIDKFELQLQRLKQKKEKKDKLESEDIPTAKTEYLALAEDARSEELQQMFGKAALIKLRDDAKQAFQTLCKSRDALKSEIDHAERQWGAQTPSYEQFLDEVAKIRALDADTRAARIKGPFPADIELKPRERATFKKLSVEEEAEARRQELAKAIADRDKGLVDENVNASTAVSTTTPGEEPSVAVVTISDETGTTPSSPGESRVARTSEASSPTDTESQATTNPPPASADSTTPDTSDAPASNTENPGFRRIKSLRVSSEVLRFLQNDFCSPRRTKSNTTLPISEILGPATKTAPTSAEQSTSAPVQRRRPSLTKTTDTKPEFSRSTGRLGSTSAGPTPRKSMTSSEPPKPKSKALLALLEKQAQSSSSSFENSSTAVSGTASNHAGMKLDFLSELKRKAGNSDKKLDDSETATAQPLQPPGITKNAGKLDLFSELTSRVGKQSGESESAATVPEQAANEAKGSDAPKKKMGFLEELTLRAKSKVSISPEEGAADSSLAPSQSAAVNLPLTPAAPTPRSFLDELKAKAQKKNTAVV